MRNNITIWLCLCLWCACEPPTASTHLDTRLHALFRQINHKPLPNQHYLIVPADACLRCVDACVEFSKVYGHHPQLSLILSSSMGVKALKLRYPNANIPPKVCLDPAGIWARDSLTQGQLYYLRYEAGMLKESHQVESQTIADFLTKLQQTFAQTKL